MNLFGNQNLNEILNKLIKIGEVSSINPAKGTARVVFVDEDSVVSYDLQVLQRNTFANKDYAMPDINEDVVCLFLPCGSEDGFILGSVYAGDITPPESDGNKRTVVFADGTKISYDRTKHILSATIRGTEEEDGTSIVATRENVNVVCSGTADIQAGTVNAKASTATVEASTINLTGNVNITGKLSVSGDITATGAVTATGDVKAMGAISLALHTHKDSSNKPTTIPQ